MKTNEIIKARRQELGLTVRDVAKRVGVGPSTVSRWDNHYKIMKYKMSLKKLCSAYKKENSKAMHLWITVKHNQITEIMVESSYRL